VARLIKRLADSEERLATLALITGYNKSLDLTPAQRALMEDLTGMGRS
jgi:hypothetical protein